MATRRRVRQLFRFTLAAAGVLLGLAALVMLARYAPNLSDFGRRHVLILGINVAAALVLLGVIAGNLFRLARDILRSAPGARLRGRLAALFVGLSVAPLLVVYVFALQFVNGGIDRWFDSGLEQELSSALRQSREALDVQARSRLSQTAALASALDGLEGDTLARALSVLRADAGADELTVFGSQLQVAGSSASVAQLPPVLPADFVTELARNRRFVALEPEGNGHYQIRAAVTLNQLAPGGATRYLQAVYPVGDRLGRLVDSVQDTYTRYSELRYLRDPLKYSIALTLSLVLLLSLLAAVGGALFFARRLTAPLEALVEGTEAVAKGDFDTRLPAGSHDEVGFLTKSFNEMIERLSLARAESRHSQQQLESERTSLAAILGNLTTGVIAVGPDGRIRIANQAASSILEADLASRVGATLDELGDSDPLLRQFVDACGPLLKGPDAAWRDQIVLRTDGGQRILNCASSRLPGEAGALAGSIVVFDDVTDLLLAQREAAWGEVARRLAHEIKNPLTPIRLAAERIRRRYLPTMGEDDGRILERSTHTIVQQVDAMRDMVNAFSEYARAPAMRVERVDLSQLAREVAWLYAAHEGPTAVRLELEEGVEIEADAVRVRQLLHNLIRNAEEALEGRTDGVIQVRVRLLPDGQKPAAELSVADNGPGIGAEMLPRLFEPYVTSKNKGTGLGLAIVRKLVEEHGGSVQAENLPEKGARVSVRLPLRMAPSEDTDDWPEHRRERA
jgi:nitrogen fixation/metabolism regulation signal transduction histidine kinase